MSAAHDHTPRVKSSYKMATGVQPAKLCRGSVAGAAAANQNIIMIHARRHC